MAEVAYIVHFKHPELDWTHWGAYPDVKEAERAIADRRKELTSPADQRIIFRILRHEIIESDLVGPVCVETCKHGHNFAKLPSHPKEGDVAQCPHCLVAKVNNIHNELTNNDVKVNEMVVLLDACQTRLGRLASVVCSLARVADRANAAEALVEYDKYMRDWQSK
jgi:hypothetical protein